MATDPSERPRISIEPFDPAKHDRTAFSCGTARIDNSLRRTAKKYHKGDFTRVWIARKPEIAIVAGFYAINAHSVHADDLPTELAKRAPRHGGIPAVYLSMLGIDLSMQGLGLGRVLMANALKRVAATSEHIGIAVMVLDVLEDGVSAVIAKRLRFYERVGFTSLPSRPYRMFLPTATIRTLLKD